jgi:hypothetical protein
MDPVIDTKRRDVVNKNYYLSLNLFNLWRTEDDFLFSCV